MQTAMDPIADLMPSCLSLPVIDGPVPVEVVFDDGGGLENYRNLLKDRAQAEMVNHLPDPNRHATPSDALLAQMESMLAHQHQVHKWPRWQPSSQYLQPLVCLQAEGIFMESLDLGRHVTVDLGADRISLGVAVDSLESRHHGLGLMVYNKILGVHVQGLVHEIDLMDRLLECRSQVILGETSDLTHGDVLALDNAAREGLKEMDYEEDDIEGHLPSTLLRETGLLPYLGRSLSLSQTKAIEALRAAGVKPARRLVQLLWRDIPAWQAIERDLSNVQSDDWAVYEPWYGLTTQNVLMSVRANGDDELPTTLMGFADELLQDSFNGDGYDTAFAVDCLPKGQQWSWAGHADYGHQLSTLAQPSGKTTAQDWGDGLLLTAVVLAKMSALDEVLIILKQFEEQHGN